MKTAVTGEGRIDGQSVQFGKVPEGCSEAMSGQGRIPAAAIAGIIGGVSEGSSDLCESAIMTAVRPDEPGENHGRRAGPVQLRG